MASVHAHLFVIIVVLPLQIHMLDITPALPVDSLIRPLLINLFIMVPSHYDNLPQRSPTVLKKTQVSPTCEGNNQEDQDQDHAQICCDL